MVEVDAARNAVLREVRVDGAEHQHAVELAGVDFHAQVVARAEGVLLLDAEVHRELLGTGEARADLDAAGGLFGHREVEVHLVGRAGHIDGFDVDFGEIAQAVDAVTREADLAPVVPGGFVLPELAADDFVARAVVAADVDAAHINPARGVGHQGKRHAPSGAVDLGPCFHPGEGEAEIAKALGEGLGGFGHVVGVVGLAGLDGDELLELVLAVEVVARELHPRDDELLAFGDVDGDGDGLLVRRHRDLGRVDAEVQIAAGEVEGLERLEVAVELGARVAVGLGVPAQPVAGGLVEQVAQRGFAKRLVADDADVLDLRGLALGHGEGEVHTVALGRGDGRDHLGAVEAAADVLALELLLGPVGERLVERTALGQTHVAQRLEQGFLVELADAGEIDVGNRRALFDDDHHHIVLHLDAHVLEQPQREQRADRRSGLLVGVGLAHAQRHGGEHGAGLDTLQALDADVAHGEGRHRQGQGRCHQQGHGRDHRPLTKWSWKDVHEGKRNEDARGAGLSGFSQKAGRCR